MTTTMGYGNVVILRSGSLKAIVEWHPAKTGARGRPQEYSDIAIETAVFIRQVFYLPLRQTEGFMNSLAHVMKAEITIPDFSSISKRSIALPKAEIETK